MQPTLYRMCISLFSLVLGVVTVCLVLFSQKKTRDRGVLYFLYALTPFLLFSLFEHLRLLSFLTGSYSLYFLNCSRFVRLFSGLGWTLFCHKHYVLNGVHDFRKKLTLPLVFVTGINCVIYLVFLITGTLSEHTYRLSNLIMTLTSFYAGLSAIILVTKKNTLYPSSWAGIRIAAMSLVIYPLAIASDIFKFTYPFFHEELLVWEQLFPYYFTLVCILVLPLFWAKETDCFVLQPLPNAALTSREREVICLLQKGKSYKEICIELHVTLPTVKTHVSNAYKKLHITKQSELQTLPLLDSTV